MAAQVPECDFTTAFSSFCFASLCIRPDVSTELRIENRLALHRRPEVVSSLGKECQDKYAAVLWHVARSGCPAVAISCAAGGGRGGLEPDGILHICEQVYLVGRLGYASNRGCREPAVAPAARADQAGAVPICADISGHP